MYYICTVHSIVHSIEIDIKIYGSVTYTYIYMTLGVGKLRRLLLGQKVMDQLTVY